MFSVFKNINSFAKKWKVLDILAIFCARFFPYIVFLFLVFYTIYISSFSLFIFAFLSGLFARFVINELVHLFYKKQRPVHTEITKLLIPLPKNYSFPSGHTSFFFGISFLLFFYNIPLGLFLLLASFLIGISRVFCGVHWFRDILAGVVAGFVSSLMVYSLISYIR